MQRYRSRSVEVSAFEFNPDKPSPVEMGDRITCVTGNYLIETVHGVEEILPGDWIIITDDGNWRKCAKEAFEGGFDLIPSRIPFWTPDVLASRG